jgi:hypothetical protein
MTTTINADNTLGGAIVTGDSSGILGLQAGGNTGLTLNSSRAVGVGASPSFGTSGQVLTSAGSAAAPTWAVPVVTTVTGTLPIANGGTGQTTATTAFDALAPSQGSNSGKYLTTNGSTTSWGTITIPATVTIGLIRAISVNCILP